MANVLRRRSWALSNTVLNARVCEPRTRHVFRRWMCGWGGGIPFLLMSSRRKGTRLCSEKRASRTRSRAFLSRCWVRVNEGYATNGSDSRRRCPPCVDAVSRRRPCRRLAPRWARCPRCHRRHLCLRVAFACAVSGAGIAEAPVEIDSVQRGALCKWKVTVWL